MAQPTGKAQIGAGALGTSTLQAALQKQRNLQQRVDSDLNSLVENFSNMVAACKVQDQTRNTQEAFQIDVHVAKITQAAESLLDVVSELKQSAIFSNFEARNDQVAANNLKYEEKAASDAKTVERLRIVIEEAHTLSQSRRRENHVLNRELQIVRDAG
ncbi:Surfeit locus protein 5 subunit 22 of Mediator complex][table7 [Klebsormidium nitens]|uniref:Surfeit locus protein 5 subunit 22 of Mediator complex][table7 n=1 Tax=Klebsormidium nitens TaxID=105231 RepID=A0A1Y1IJQ2_KLENI|nr:Surfeit locus protein 5 subunit 22 of Mediator complex][table7 [Klebsormidium nitens]|eukprot:GAQ88857.1 Surfeit locus protein 5 subunit 22 of Mediator complex][table7 [Klebsormidium nitens]